MIPTKAILLSVLSVMVLLSGGCKKSTAESAIQTDANGYFCVQCGVKLYTDSSNFIGPQCPKCQKTSLMDVVGYVCEKDQHLTIRPSRNDPAGAPVCDQCKAPVSTMRMPHEKDLKAWGATKAS